MSLKDQAILLIEQANYAEVFELLDNNIEDLEVIREVTVKIGDYISNFSRRLERRAF